MALVRHRMMRAEQSLSGIGGNRNYQHTAYFGRGALAAEAFNRVTVNDVSFPRSSAALVAKLRELLGRSNQVCQECGVRQRRAVHAQFDDLGLEHNQRPALGW